MARKPRVVIPENVGDLLELGEKIYEKHKADGANSPLRTMVDYNWDTIGPKMEPALDWHKKAEQYRKLAEQAYGERNILMGDIDGAAKATRDVLLGVYSKTPKTLGEWGLEVNDSPAPKKASKIQ